MTLPIERFKDTYVNHRWNPFTDTDMSVDKVEDGLFIPSGSPFLIQLLEVARYNDPTSVSVRCYGVDTTVDADSASGQPVLNVADTTGFSPGDNVIINRGGTREEEKIIDTIQAGVSLTMTVNLEYTHTAGQADAVEKFIAFTETAGAPAQSQFRVDYPPAQGEGTGLVEFNSNDADKEVRISYKATGSSALAETLDTKISYPAGIPDDNQIVGFSSGVPLWLQLPHTNLAGVSADQHHAQVHTHASHTDIGANDHHAQNHASRHSSGQPDVVNHDNLAGFVAAEHKSLPNTISQVLSDHNKAAHVFDTLGGSYVWNPGSMADGLGASCSVPVTGAALGDGVMVFPPYDMQNCLYCGYVSAPNTARIRIQNETGSTINFSSGTWKVKVYKY